MFSTVTSFHRNKAFTVKGWHFTNYMDAFICIGHIIDYSSILPCLYYQISVFTEILRDFKRKNWIKSKRLQTRLLSYRIDFLKNYPIINTVRNDYGGPELQCFSSLGTTWRRRDQRWEYLETCYGYHARHSQEHSQKKKVFQWFFRMVKYSTWALLLSEPG